MDSCGGSNSPMISMQEALGIVLSVVLRLEVVIVPLQDSLGKILAQDIHAPDPLPPYPASIKDGYAVVSSDGPGVYPVVMESRAGNYGFGVTVTPGTVAYVTTGDLDFHTACYKPTTNLLAHFPPNSFRLASRSQYKTQHKDLQNLGFGGSRSIGFFSSLTSPTIGMGRSMYRGHNAPLTCKVTSSLEAVMAQMLSHMATHVWVAEAEDEESLVRLVGYANILATVTRHPATLIPATP